MHPGFRWRGSLRWLRRTVVADPENWAADVLSAVLGGKFIRPGYRSQLITSVHSPTVEPEDLFVVRAAGDEASISLAAGQFLGSISAVLHRQLTHLRLWAVVIILVQVFVLAALIGHPASLILRILVYVFVVAALAPVVAVTVLLAAALPFGWDGPFLSIFASCSAEAAPPGQATILQLEPFAQAENRGLAHSGLYQSEPVITKIVTLICGSPPVRATSGIHGD